MKLRKFTPSKAVLPENEQIIGGDAPRGFENKKRVKEIDKILEKFNKQQKKNKPE
jgi:hypothetical protein